MNYLMNRLYRNPLGFAGSHFAELGAKGAYPGVETPVTLDVPDDSTVGDLHHEYRSAA